MVAAIVVSDINDKLSPNIAPQITVATQREGEKPPFCEVWVAIGIKTAIVPTLVPVAIDIIEDIKKRPTVIKFGGMKLRRQFAMLDAPPTSLAIPLKAPDSRNINIIMTIFSSANPLAQIFILSSNESFRFCINAKINAIQKATTIGIM